MSSGVCASSGMEAATGWGVPVDGVGSSCFRDVAISASSSIIATAAPVRAFSRPLDRTFQGER